MRSLKKEEHDLIVYLLNDKPNTDHIIEKLPTLMVEEMNDGGMGSLSFLSHSGEEKKFGGQIAQVTLLDFDEIPVSIAIYIDEEDQIFELDVFKADYSPLKQFPLPPYQPL